MAPRKQSKSTLKGHPAARTTASLNGMAKLREQLEKTGKKPPTKRRKEK